MRATGKSYVLTHFFDDDHRCPYSDLMILAGWQTGLCFQFKA
jgi:hypothetical protein